MKRVAWWIQLVESTPLSQDQAMFSEFDRWYSFELGESAKAISDWRWNSCVPDFIQLQGFGPPPNIETLFDAIRNLMLDGEYMVFAQMVDAVLRTDAVTYHIVTRDVVATMEGRKYIRDAIERIWEMGIDQHVPQA